MVLEAARQSNRHSLSRGIVDAAVRAGERDFDDLQARLRRAVSGYLGAAG